MKIVHYIAEKGWGGGPQIVFWLAQELACKDFQVEIWSSSQSLIERATRANIPCELVPHGRHKAVVFLRKKLKNDNPCVFHLHGVRAGIVGGWAAKNLPHSLVYTEHHLTRDIPISFWRKKIQVKLLRGVLSEASAVIVPSRACANFLLQQKICIEEKLHLIPHGLPKVTSPLPLKLDLARPVIGSIGSLLPVKNFDLLIRAVCQLSGVSLAIAGGGPAISKLRTLCKSLKLEKRVRFLGTVEDPYPFLAALDLYAQPSSSESFGLAALQAMQMGLPVVVSSRGALPELVEAGKDGIVVARFSPQAWAKEIQSLLENSSRRKMLGAAASKKVAKHFSLEKMAQAHREVYQNLLQWR